MHSDRIAVKSMSNNAAAGPYPLAVNPYFSMILLLSLALWFHRCKPVQDDPHPLLTALHSENPAIKKVMRQPDAHEIQVIFSRINRQGDQITFTDFGYQVDNDRYFYPASSVKLPIAVLALEKLNSIDTLNRDTRFFVEGDTVVTSFAEDISRVFAVSDNEANNRLMEFLGQDAINEGILEKGAGPIRISHRLGVHSDDVVTKPLLIYLNDSTTAPTHPIFNTAPKPLSLQHIQKGRGYYEDDTLHSGPFDFSLKNYYPLTTQHEVLKRVIFPQAFPEEQRFHLSDGQRQFLLNAMQTLPREAGYNEASYQDGYAKFFIIGDSPDRKPGYLHIFNKAGWAYGTLTDCAYIQDTENGVEFLLSATILVNPNGIFNDDDYAYEETGIPFLAALGRVLYDMELQQAK